MKGVNILLEPQSKIPLWIRAHDVTARVTKVRDKGGRCFRRLRIEGGEAYFMMGGVVYVRMATMKEGRQAFGERLVLAIRGLETNALITRNHHRCPDCHYNWGEILEQESGGTGKAATVFKCRQCARTWGLRI